MNKLLNQSTPDPPDHNVMKNTGSLPATCPLGGIGDAYAFMQIVINLRNLHLKLFSKAILSPLCDALLAAD